MCLMLLYTSGRPRSVSVAFGRQLFGGSALANRTSQYVGRKKHFRPNSAISAENVCLFWAKRPFSAEIAKFQCLPIFSYFGGQISVSSADTKKTMSVYHYHARTSSTLAHNSKIHFLPLPIRDIPSPKFPSSHPSSNLEAPRRLPVRKRWGT